MFESKKITLLISSLSGGGAEGVCVNVANGLAENGWTVDLVVLNTNDAAYLNRISEKVNLIVLRVGHVRQAPRSLLRYIYKEKPKTILAFNYELAVLLVILRSIFRFKIKIIARNINTLSHKRSQYKGWRRRLIVKPLIDACYSKTDHVINQCQDMRDDLISVFPQLADKASVIYNPVAKHVEEYAKAHDLTQIEKNNYLLCVGRLEKQKAFHYAIESFAGIANDFPTLRLKIVGQGSLEQSLKQCAQDFGVADRVDFEGFQADVIPYYLHARAILLTSLYEGFPNVLIESITLGTPFVSFDCPSGPREIIENRKNGVLVEYLNTEALRDRLNQFLSSKEMTRESVLETASRFSLLSAVSQYEDVINSVHGEN